MFRTLLPAIMALVFAAVACSEDDTDANDLALGYVWGTISQSPSAEQLQDLMTDELQQRTTEEEVLDRLECIPLGSYQVLLEQDVQRSGDTATITARYRVSPNAGDQTDVREFERVWEFQRVEDGWLLSDLPSCPFP